MANLRAKVRARHESMTRRVPPSDSTRRTVTLPRRCSRTQTHHPHIMAPRLKKTFRERSNAEPETEPFVHDGDDSDDHGCLEADDPPSIDPYAVLGLDKDATSDHVKKAYRNMALKHHPGMCALRRCSVCPPADACKTRHQRTGR